MRKLVAVSAVAVLSLGPLAPAAWAAVNVERQGAENPVLEVAKSTRSTAGSRGWCWAVRWPW